MTNTSETHDWLDPASALEKLDGDETLYRELIAMFLDRDMEDVASIREHLNRDAYAEAYRFIHTLKGLAGTLGFSALHTVMLAMDKAYKSEQYEQIKSSVESMEKEMNRALTGSRELLQRERLS